MKNTIAHNAHRHFVHDVAADYNLRIPFYIRHAALIGIIALVAAAISWRLLPDTQAVLAGLIALIGLLLAIPSVAFWALLKFAQRRRFAIRHRIINSIPWRGDEHVLDVGTGSGIMLFGCAKRLSTGRGVGIDIYQPHAGGSTPEIFWRNAHVEGVQSRVDLQNVDARHMPFSDASFDVIVSSFALHHIGHSAADRAQATREMLRVLKPGGYISLYDVALVVNASLEAMQQADMQNISASGQQLTLLTARKPNS
jgi:arsenite methyltransferase